MSRLLSFCGWAALAGMTGLASLLYIHATRSNRIEREAASRLVLDAVLKHTRKMELGDARTRGILEVLREDQAALRRALDRLSVQGIAPVAQEGGHSESEATTRATQAEDDPPLAAAEQGADEPDLPPVPEGVNPTALLRGSTDLKAIVEDPRFNPTKTELTRTERFKLHAELVRARAKLDVLDAEIRVGITDGMETLRERGEHIDYAPGQSYETEPGVLTAGEEIEGGGVRLFYLYPEEFGDVYAKRLEREKAAETAVRRIAARLNPMQMESK